MNAWKSCGNHVFADRGGEVAAILARLKALGVRLAIDDFGAGYYSSPSCLARFPVDPIKVDESFVRGIPDDRASAEIAAAIIALANLELNVIAADVEMQAQPGFVTGRRCNAFALCGDVPVASFCHGSKVAGF